MITQTKIGMTEKNLIKHMKRLKKDTKMSLLNTAYMSENNELLFTDSHRAVKQYNPILESRYEEHIDYDSRENTDKINRLFSRYDDSNDLAFQMHIDEIKLIKKVLNAIKSVGVTTGDNTVDITFKGNKINIKATHKVMADISIEYTDSLIYTNYIKPKEDTILIKRFNVKYMVDLFDYIVDSKVSIVEFKVNVGNMTPLFVIGSDFMYQLLPIRVV